MTDQDALRRCARRIHQYEKAIQIFLDAYDGSEMSNVAEAVEHFRLLLAQR